MFSPEIPRAGRRSQSGMENPARTRRRGRSGPRASARLRNRLADARGDRRGRPFYDGIQHLRETGDAFQYGGPHLCAGRQISDARTAKGTSARSICRALAPAGGQLPRQHAARQAVQHPDLRRDRSADRRAARRRLHECRRRRHSCICAAAIAIALVNDLGRYEGRVFLAPIAPGNLQVHWPEGNVIIRRGVVDKLGGVPDYNAVVRIERLTQRARPHANANRSRASHDQPRGGNGDMSHLPAFGEHP